MGQTDIPTTTGGAHAAPRGRARRTDRHVGHRCRMCNQAVQVDRSGRCALGHQVLAAPPALEIDLDAPSGEGAGDDLLSAATAPAATAPTDSSPTDPSPTMPLMDVVPPVPIDRPRRPAALRSDLPSVLDHGPLPAAEPAAVRVFPLEPLEPEVLGPASPLRLAAAAVVVLVVLGLVAYLAGTL